MIFGNSSTSNDERLSHTDRRKKYRWNDASEENNILNAIKLTTQLSSPMTPEQLDAYALNFRIEEITIKLRFGDVVPKDRERSPSPTPQYDSQGKRTNTREVRYRTKLETERHKLIQRALKEIPNYKPPADYKKPPKIQEKIFIPVDDFPGINFIGLLIGPRGHTLKKMESESGAKIAVRGKGSVKEGKGKADGPHQATMNENLHVLITAEEEHNLNKAIQLVNQVIETAASTPEEQNELKRGQLRELAALNGTLRNDDTNFCPICGDPGHRKIDCPSRKSYSNNIVCRFCGSAGHLSRDCKSRPSSGYGNSYRSNDTQNSMSNLAAEEEYHKLMQELGTDMPSSPSSQNRLRLTDSNHNKYNSNTNNQPRGGPAPWQQRNSNQGNNDSQWQNNHYENRGNYNNYNNRQGYDRGDRPNNYRNDRDRGDDYNNYSNNSNNYNNNNNYNNYNKNHHGYNNRYDNNDNYGRNQYNNNHHHQPPPPSRPQENIPPSHIPTQPAMHQLPAFSHVNKPAPPPGLSNIHPPGKGLPPPPPPPGKGRLPPPPPPGSARLPPPPPS